MVFRTVLVVEIIDFLCAVADTEFVVDIPCEDRRVVFEYCRSALEAVFKHSKEIVVYRLIDAGEVGRRISVKSDKDNADAVLSCKLEKDIDLEYIALADLSGVFFVSAYAA